MTHVPEAVKDYLREVPVRWDETRFVDGYPGRLVIIARRAGERWYVAGINGENVEKNVSMDLSFIDQQKGSLFSDGKEQFSFSTQQVELSGNNNYEISLKPNGGLCACVLEIDACIKSAKD
jgi:alpha-glucosidase